MPYNENHVKDRRRRLPFTAFIVSLTSLLLLLIIFLSNADILRTANIIILFIILIFSITGITFGIMDYSRGSQNKLICILAIVLGAIPLGLIMVCILIAISTIF